MVESSIPEVLLDDAQMASLLSEAKTIAVVGVSPRQDRASNQVAKYLKEHLEAKIFLVNPLIDELWGERVYHSLAEVREATSAEIDIVDVFRKSEDIPAVMDEVLRVGAKSFWMQLGISNPREADRGRKAGLEVIQNRCIKIEVERLLN